MPSIDISTFNANKKKGRLTQKQSLNWCDFLNKDIKFGNKQLSDKKKEAFYIEISSLLSSGIDLKTALELIVSDQDKRNYRDMFVCIKNDVLNGNSLSEAIENTSRFSKYEYHSIKIGEETGKIAEVLTDLAKFYKSKIGQRRKVISAVTYPIIVLMTSAGAVLFMLKFVVPMFADVFQRFGGELPWVTTMIIRISAIMDKYFFSFCLLAALILIFIFFSKNRQWFRKISSTVILKIPVVGDLVRKIYLARFANTMRLLVGTDIPLLRSIALVRQMIGFYPIETSLAEVEQLILNGESLNASLSKCSFYPPKLVQLIKVGEEVNRLGYFFEKIASQYTEEVEYQTSTISSLLEPMIIIFLGLVVGVILIAMYLPLFQMSNSF